MEGSVLVVGAGISGSGETVNDDFISEYCSLCGECTVDHTGGLCPLTLCTKGLLNGPCSGAINGKCEADKTRDYGWRLIYHRLKGLGQLNQLHQYIEPKSNLKWGRPRSLTLKDKEATFKSLIGNHSVSRCHQCR